MNLSMPNKSRKILVISIVCLLVAVAVIVTVMLFAGTNKLPEFSGSSTEITDKSKIDLGEELYVTAIGNYTGLFLEDGSDRVVTNVMMLMLENSSDKDLQLARVNIVYDDFTAEFEATNIPSGKSVVLLEKNCRQYSDEEYNSISLSNISFFKDSMSLMEDSVSVTGGDGYVQIDNVSSKDINGTTYVYYKNIASDTFYGGITYRAKLEETIKAGESVRIPTQHFNEGNSCVVQVTNFE